MEEEEEILSHPSPGSEPHSPPSGRITVTVAAAAAPSSSSAAAPPSSLTLALPIQHPSRPSPASTTTATAAGGGREDCWSEGATSVLIDAWGERYMELSRGNLKQKHWKEVADIVSSREDYAKAPKTDIQCKNRIDTVKKKYKIEKAKVASGCGPSRWPFFDRLDRLIGPSSAAASSVAKVVSPVVAGGSAQKPVPVGIPVGVRPLPLPGLSHFSPHHQMQTPPHLQQPPPQQQQFRQSNFAPSPVFNKLYNSTNDGNNNVGNVSNSSKQFRRGPAMPLPSVDYESDPEEMWSQDSGDSLPPLERAKRQRVELNISGRGRRRRKKEMRVWGKSVRELTRAILKFGEAYEAAESAKLQQIVEMEKQRMKFAKELELQRMKFLMKTQLELSQLNENGNNNSTDSRGGGSSGRRGGDAAGAGETNHHENHVNHANSDSSN